MDAILTFTEADRIAHGKGDFVNGPIIAGVLLRGERDEFIVDFDDDVFDWFGGGVDPDFAVFVDPEGVVAIPRNGVGGAQVDVAFFLVPGIEVEIIGVIFDGNDLAFG